MANKVVAYYAMLAYCGHEHTEFGTASSYNFEDCVLNFVAYFANEEDCQFDPNNCEDLMFILEALCDANGWDVVELRMRIIVDLAEECNAN